MNCPKCKYFMHRRDEQVGVDNNGFPIEEIHKEKY